MVSEQCPECKKENKPSWNVCLFCGEEKQDSWPRFPQRKLLIVSFSVFLMILTPLLVAMIYMTYFGEMEWGFRRNESAQLSQAIPFEDKDEEDKE